MNSQDNINFNLHGNTVKFLTIDDVIEVGDFIRDLVETGSEGGFDTTYKPFGWRGISWHKVDTDFSGWIGKSYHDFLKFAKAESVMRHELVRIIT
jgi:hypothetical protein